MDLWKQRVYAVLKEQNIREVIKYIEDRLNEQPYEGSWITDTGERVSADLGYVYDWWRDCMKPELIRKFLEGQE